MATKDLTFRFLGVDGGAGREFDKMIGKSGSLEKALGKVALGMAAAGVAIGVESVRAAAKFQQSMELIHTQAGRSQKTVDAFSKSVLAMSGSVATAPDELAKGLYHLASTGMSAANTMKALKVAAEGAKLGGADLESVTNALNATIVSGIKGSGDFNKAMGALNATVGAGDMRMQDLADAMSTGVLTVAKNFGVSLNSVGAALAVFGDNNIRGADAATKLSQSITYLEKPAKGADAVLKGIGLSTKQLRSDMGSGGLGKTLADLHDHLVKAGDTGTKIGPILLDAFGRKPAGAINTLLGEYKRFQDKQVEVAKGSKSFASDWTSYTQTFGYSWDRAKSAFESMTIQIGTKLLPVATKAMNWIGTKGVADLDKFGGWVSRNKTPIEDLAKVLAVIAGTRFAVSKLNDLQKMVGGRGILGRGGGLLGSASKAEPVPVFVTNEGFGGGDDGGVLGGVAGEGKAARALRLAGNVTLVAGAGITAYATTMSILKNTSVGNAVTRASDAIANFEGVGPKQAAARELDRLQNDTGQALIKRYGSLDKALDALRRHDADAVAIVNAGAAKSETAVQRAANKMGDAWGGAARTMAAQQQRADNQILGSLRGIPGVMRQVAGQAKAAGLTIGEQLDAGITVGIRQGSGNINIVSTSVIDGVRTTMSKRASIQSPSKMTAHIGRMLSEGLGVGMQQGMSMVEHASQSVIDKVLSKLGGLKGSRSGMAEGISSNLIQASSLSNMPLASLTTAFGTSYTAAPTVAGMLGFESGYLSRERAFARNLGLARKKGLTPGQIADIAQMGLDAGGPIAAALAGGSAGQARSLSSVLSQVNAVAGQIGSASAGAVYDRQVKLLEDLLAELRRLPHATGQAVSSAMKHPGTQKTLASSATRARRAK